MRNFYPPPVFQYDVGAEFALEPDAQLMLQFRAGDSTSFEVLLVKHRTPIVGYLTRMTGNQGVAEELAQEVFLRVYRNRDGYEPSAKFTTWLYRIATNLALNSIRDRRHEKKHRSLDEPPSDARPTFEVAEPRASQEETMLADARLAVVREAVAGLPERQRAAVLMHKYQELDYQQIGEALDLSVSAVKSLLFRAYETLRRELSSFATNYKRQRA